MPSFQAVATWPDGDKLAVIREGRSEQEVALAIEAERLAGDVDFDLSIHPVKRADQLASGDVVRLDGETWEVHDVNVRPSHVRLVLVPVRWEPQLGREQMVEVVSLAGRKR